MSDAADQLEDVFVNSRLVSQSNDRARLYVKVCEIFMYDGLPLTIPKRILERYLTQNGGAVVYEHEGDLFVTDKLPNSDENMNGDYTRLTVKHGKKGSKKKLELEVGKNCVLVRSDNDMIGLDPLITEFSLLTAQTKISWLQTLVTLRKPYHLQAKDERAQKSAEIYEDALRSGDAVVLFAEEFDEMEGVNFHQAPQGADVAGQVIELSQFIASYYYGELGVTVNNNMKSQYVNKEEIQKSTGIPLVNNMLQCRQEALRDIEALFGVTITVQTSEAWSEGKVQIDEEPGLEEDEGSEDGQGDPDAVEDAPGGDGDGAGDAEGEDEAAAEEEAPEGEAVDETPAVPDERETATKEEVVEAAEALEE